MNLILSCDIYYIFFIVKNYYNFISYDFDNDNCHYSGISMEEFPKHRR